jgi:uncharacterized protein (UPF0303 family)
MTEQETGLRTPKTAIQLENDEAVSQFDSFNAGDAWELGVEIRRRGVAGHLPIMIDIRRPSGVVLFHAALEGATTDHEDWIRRKFATVLRFETSSAVVASRMARDGRDTRSIPWLSERDYAIAGGGFPIHVNGTGLVAVVCVSGLSAEQDHDLIVDSIHAVTHRRSTTGPTCR